MYYYIGPGWTRMAELVTPKIYGRVNNSLLKLKAELYNSALNLEA